VQSKKWVLAWPSFPIHSCDYLYYAKQTALVLHLIWSRFMSFLEMFFWAFFIQFGLKKAHQLQLFVSLKLFFLTQLISWSSMFVAKWRTPEDIFFNKKGLDIPLGRFDVLTLALPSHLSLTKKVSQVYLLCTLSTLLCAKCKGNGDVL